MKKKNGRPAIRTEKNAAKVCALVKRGMPFNAICGVLKIGRSTFNDWKAKDKKFQEAIEAAQAEGIEYRLAVIEEAAKKGDWRASAWMLEHLFPEHFSKHRIEHSHIHTASVRHEFAVSKETLNQIAEARSRFEEKRASILVEPNEESAPSGES